MIDIIHTNLIKYIYEFDCMKLKYMPYTDYIDMNINRLDFILYKSDYEFQTVCLCKDTLIVIKKYDRLLS